MSSMRSMAAATDSPTPPTYTVPSSWISMEAPVSSWMPRITLPPEPMTSRMLSTGMVIVWILGAVARVSSRGAGTTSSILPRMNARPSLACSSARRRMSNVRPVALLSICSAVMPRSVPVTLKSMSPRKSSMPWISDRTTVSPSSWIRPMAMPETGRLMGTPPSMRARQLPQVDAIEEEPLDSMTSETTRMAYGNSFSSGRTGSSARSARLPWPISRRFGEPMRPVSPVQKGGKL